MEAAAAHGWLLRISHQPASFISTAHAWRKSWNKNQPDLKTFGKVKRYFLGKIKLLVLPGTLYVVMLYIYLANASSMIIISAIWVYINCSWHERVKVIWFNAQIFWDCFPNFFSLIIVVGGWMGMKGGESIRHKTYFPPILKHFLEAFSVFVVSSSSMKTLLRERRILVHCSFVWNS